MIFRPLTILGLSLTLLVLGGEDLIAGEIAPATQRCDLVLKYFDAPRFVLVKFTQDTTYFPQPIPDLAGTVSRPEKLVLISTGTLASACAFAQRPGGFTLFDSVVDPRSVAERTAKGIPVFQRETVAYTPKGIRRLIDAAGQKQQQLQIVGVGKYPLPPTSLIDVALGLRGYGAADWISKGELERAKKSQDGNLVTFDMSRGDDVEDIFTYDTSRGCVVTEYRLEVASKLLVLLKNNQFSQFGGAWFPRSVSMTGYWYSSGKAKPIETDALSIGAVDTTDNVNTEKFYDFSVAPNSQTVKDAASTKPALQAEHVSLTPMMQKDFVVPSSSGSTLGAIPTFISVSEQKFVFQCKPRASVKHAFMIANNDTKPVTITGILRECGCVEIPEMPIDIDPDSAVAVPVVINVGSRSGRFAKQLIVQLSKDGLHPFSLDLDIEGQIDR